MKRMSEVFELPVDKSAAFAYGFATIEEAAKSGKYPAAQHAAHAINNVDALAENLEEALLQIEYLHQTFEETGSGNSVLLRGYAVLNAYRGEK